MKKNKVLITGGAGFIGYHLSKKLSANGFHVDIIDNLSRGKKDKELIKLLTNKNINFKNLDLSLCTITILKFMVKMFILILSIQIKF